MQIKSVNIIAGMSRALLTQRFQTKKCQPRKSHAVRRDQDNMSRTSSSIEWGSLFQCNSYLRVLIVIQTGYAGTCLLCEREKGGGEKEGESGGGKEIKGELMVKAKDNKINRK